MKRYSTLAFSILFALLLVFPDSSKAQKRKKPSTSRSSTAPTPAADMRPEATKVAEQIKTASKFLYVYGKVANSLEFAEEQAKLSQPTAAVAAQNQKSKQGLVASITGLRAGLDGLASSFKANSRLQVQYLKLSYAAEAAANAERLANAGQFNEAGKSLVAVVERLADTMMSMRLQ